MKEEEHIKILARSLDIQKLQYSIELEEIEVNIKIEAFQILKKCINIEHYDKINASIFKRLYSLKNQLQFLESNRGKTLVDYKE